MKLFRLCFLIPILFLNIHFLSRRIVYECIPIYYNNNNNNNFLKELYELNLIIIYNFQELVSKLKKEFQYYLFSTIIEKLEFFFYQWLFFYKKECNETFVKYLYFVFWTFIEISQLFQFSPNVNLFSFPHFRYRLVFFTIITLFYFTPTSR
jgi:hypothetical protein